jgi:Rrf2 family cysteine metabolism transcriptional repressor
MDILSQVWTGGRTLNFTSKEEYGLLAVIYIAGKKAEHPIQSKEIASAECIPEQFLDQVLAGLRRGGIVRSIRGASGGYELARPAADITAGDVIRALSGPIANLSEKQEMAGGMLVVRELLERVQAAISGVLDSTTVENLVEEKLRREETGSFMMHI